MSACGTQGDANPHATFDWETKSAAGFVWNDEKKAWEGPPGSGKGKKGLGVIGSAAYAEHPSTDILCLNYKLPGMVTGRRWRPGQPLPQDLFDYLAAGGLIEAHNVMFERLIWWFIAGPKYGFPPLNPEQLQCSMATARVNSLPGKLENLADVLQLPIRKNPDGSRILRKLSVPQKPTKTKPKIWINPEDDPAEFEKLYAYNDDDVAVEECASAAMPPMTRKEREFWLIDQEINWRGLGVDRKGVRDCVVILNQALARYGQEMREITGGLDPTQIEKLKGWLAAYHVYMNQLDSEAVEEALLRPSVAPHPPGGLNPVRRVLELRALVGSASVKKLFAMENMASNDNRLRNLIVHHGARTGRPTGEGAQPLNMPKAGPKLVKCGGCDDYYVPTHDACPTCATPAIAGAKALWTPAMIECVLRVMASHSLELVEWYFGDALLAISGCLRGLFVADEGNDLIASDYSAIEAVVIAALSGETWRNDTFKAKVDIYLSSASKITGMSVEAYLAYAEAHGENHPDRQKIGKVAELGLGFGGWIGAWRQFDDTDTFSDAEVKALILAWRAASPAIVELWGGQWRGLPWGDWPESYAEFYGMEGAAILAIQNPGTVQHVRLKRPNGQWENVPGVTLFMRGDALIVRMPSTRELTYHNPRLAPSTRDYHAPGELSITYNTWNSNPKYGVIGWVCMSTFGGRLTENLVQAVAHDILRNAIILLRMAGYPTVLHVYDEIVVEVRKGFGSIEEVERIMATLPPWCLSWAIRASGGWRGYRYRKG